MKHLLASLLVAQVITCSGILFAYEIPTHQALSEKTVDASVLQTDGTILSNIGLDPLSKKQQFPNSNRESRTISQLVQDGAAFEDSGRRPLNHFYDPLNDWPLTHAICWIFSCRKSPDWALEDTGVIDGQDDSFSDARGFFLNALTNEIKEEREQAFGRTFQALGQVIHHLQDMAQPQHVRNDDHADFESFDFPFLENPSLYEKHINRPEVRGTFQLLAPYEQVDFAKARDFWAIDSGQGIAQFTNHNFVSAGTNFQGAINNIQPDPDYPFPNGHNAQLTIKRIEDPDLLGPDQPLRGQMVFIGTPIEDKYTGTTGFNPRTSTYSIFDPDLETYSPTFAQTYTLNRFNFDAAHQFLIPRAVAYSAGLINYFFRGKMDFEPDSDPQNLNGYLIKNLGTEDMHGTFTLYYDDAEGNRHPVLKDADGKAQGWPTTQSIPPQGTLSVAAFDRPTNPPPKDAKSYMLVFTGMMGHEAPVNQSVGAVVGKQVTVDLSPSFLLFNQYTLTPIPNGWALGQSGTPLLYGNIDWQGEETTLSFQGPTNRYQSSSFALDFSNVIYSQGQVVALAPEGLLVQSAAVQTDPIDPTQKRLIAMLLFFDPEGNAFSDSVWAKPLAAPDSVWEKLFDVPRDVGDGVKTFGYFWPWHFSQDGRKACTIGGSGTYSVDDDGSFSIQNDYYSVEVMIDSGAVQKTFVGSAVVSVQTEPELVQTQSGSSLLAVDYKGNMLTQATVTENSHFVSQYHDEGYSRDGTGRYAFLIDGIEQFAGTNTETIDLTHPGSTSCGPSCNVIGQLNAETHYLKYLDLRAPWYSYTKWHVAGEATGGQGPWPTAFSLEFGSNRTGVLYERKVNALSYLQGTLNNGVVWWGLGNGTWAMDRKGAVSMSEQPLVWLMNEDGSASLDFGEEWINFITDGDLEALTGVSGPITPIGVW